MAIEGGLFTPVIRKAETKSLSAISAEMKDLAARARERKLLPHEYQGGVGFDFKPGDVRGTRILRHHQPAAVDDTGGRSRPAQT